MRDLLKHLVCPVTKKNLIPLSKQQLEKLNQCIAQGTIYYNNGKKVSQSVNKALITQNKTLIYLFQSQSGQETSDIPILIEEKAIATRQITNWKLY